MKKNDFIFIAAALAFSIMFYKQNVGLNLFLFDIIVIAMLAFFNPGKIVDKRWWYYAGLTVIPSVFVVINNSGLSIFSSIVLIFLLCGKTYNSNNSVIISFAFSVYSVVSAFIYWIIDLSSSTTVKNETTKRRNIKLFVGILISLIIALIFFFLYQESNPLFKDFTSYISFDWLSFSWILFTFWGFLVVYGLIKNRKIDIVSQIDHDSLVDIKEVQGGSEDEELKYKSIIAMSLFVILNVMLLIINLLDINQILINHSLPKGITLSSFVHQAVWSTVASIVIASVLIMWFFKDELNFNKFGRKVKLLVYAWIIQSALMIISTIIRNYWYIQEYQLTYLRIGVFTFLILSIIGLIHSVLKLSRQKSAWRLLTNNVETWFLILALSSVINWDKLITRYNIAHSYNGKELDVEYLTCLSDANIPELVELNNLKYSTIQIGNERTTSPLYSKLFLAKEKLKERSWQSFNLRDMENRETLNNINFVINGKE